MRVDLGEEQEKGAVSAVNDSDDLSDLRHDIKGHSAVSLWRSQENGQEFQQ